MIVSKSQQEGRAIFKASAHDYISKVNGLRDEFANEFERAPPTDGGAPNMFET